MQHNTDYILKLAHDNQVKFIRLWFTDVLGFLKSFAITIEELEDALMEGVRFDGATVQSLLRSEEEEMIAMPDASTFQILPWRPREDSVARMFCDIHHVDMTPYEADSRYILKRILKKAAEKGLSFYTGLEIEFFFFKNSQTPEILDRGGYFDLTPLDNAADYRRQTVLTLGKMGIDVISSHHEASYSQHEIDLRHSDALSTADNLMTFKLVAKEIAATNGIHASFMPKPFSGSNGSGLHIHQSLFRDDENIFFNDSSPDLISAECKSYIAGLLRHCNEFFTITNQWINSYKRFARGFESPTHAAWSHKSHNTLVRVPKCKPGKPESMRVELRNPDPACNPYLSMAVILSAGLKGIEGGYELPAPLDLINISEKNHDPLNPRLPRSLDEALVSFENSTLMKETLGDHVHSMICTIKQNELDRFHSYITDYEIDEYLPIL